MKYGNIISSMQKIIADIEKKPDQTSRFRIDSYNRVIEKLKRLGVNKSVSKLEINKLDATDYMKNKILEIYNLSNKYNVSNKYNLSSKYDAHNLSTVHTIHTVHTALTQIMGIGPKKAQQLIDLGFSPKNNEVEIDKIAQELRKAKWQNYLGNETKLFLAANPKTPITRAEIKIVENEIKKLNVCAQIVGSYRRKKPISNDIDILVRVDDRNTLNRFVEMLPGKKYICSRGPDKIAIIYSPKRKSAAYKPVAYKPVAYKPVAYKPVAYKPVAYKPVAYKPVAYKPVAYKHVAYKIDVFGASPNEFIPMLLYSTGSKEFNIEMRRRAKSLGYLLNQRGIFERATGKKISGLKTELAYFKFLKMPFLEPEAR